MSVILVNIADGLKAMYWRAVIRGATMPANDLWKFYVVILSGLLLIAIALVNNLLASEIEAWRVYLGWGLIGFCTLVALPLAIVTIYGHHYRDEFDPMLLKQYDVEPLELSRSVIIAAVTVPPLFRYILSLFGWET